MDNKTLLIVLMVVIIVLIALLIALGTVFIVALRKRAPVVKVVMAPPAAQDDDDDEKEELQHQVGQEQPAANTIAADTAVATESAAPVPPLSVEPDDDDDDEDAATFVTEGQERVRYDRSFNAKICQLKKESKDWYSALKNELLSYERVKERMSWKRETYRVGRMPLARFVVRGKTLCLLLAVEPAGYNGTKYTVEDVSNVASTADTPTLFRIKSERRLKYAKEMIAGIMKELKLFKNPRYEAKDFFLPYEGDMALMQRGLVKRVVTGSTRVFRIEEVDKLPEQEAAAAEDGAPSPEKKAEATEPKPEATETKPAAKKPAKKAQQPKPEAKPESDDKPADGE